jgi:UDP-N-acetylglucosamine 1-carboxyvinyltransferase
MSTFEIIGGQPLKGELTPQGAKNEALQILCATLLTEEKVTIHNIPNILDVNKLIELLSDLGVQVSQEAKNSYTFRAKDINLEYLNSPEFAKKGASLRGSNMIIGPL